VWIDGRPLMDVIEPYRRKILLDGLYTFDGDRPRYNRVLCGRAKKNWKTTDLVLAMFYRFLAWESDAGNDCFVLANDEEQAHDDLSLAKKLIAANLSLNREIKVYAKELVRRDGRGSCKILPAQDVAGSHGKTFLFLGFDEIHGYRNYDIFEALSPDPSRPDVLTWITSYAGIRHASGVPLYDLFQLGRARTDPRMFFSWYSASFSTDPAFNDPSLTSEQRANPSMLSWGNDEYLVDQKLRLPSFKFRRLHLNEPSAPDQALLSSEAVFAAIVSGRKQLSPHPGIVAFVDMSGGSQDFAVLAIAFAENAYSERSRPPIPT
jgi:hypothetical protein